MNSSKTYTINNFKKIASQQLDTHKKMGSKTSLTIFEVAQLMDTINLKNNLLDKSQSVKEGWTNYSLN